MRKRIKGIFSKQNLYSALLSIILIGASSVSFAEPTFVTGTKKLFQDAGLWITGLIPVCCGAFVGLLALQKSLTQDQAVIASNNKLIKNTIIGGIIGTVASGTVTFILAYYK